MHRHTVCWSKLAGVSCAPLSALWVFILMNHFSAPICTPISCWIPLGAPICTPISCWIPLGASICTPLLCWIPLGAPIRTPIIVLDSIRCAHVLTLIVLDSIRYAHMHTLIVLDSTPRNVNRWPHPSKYFSSSLLAWPSTGMKRVHMSRLNTVLRLYNAYE